MTRSDAFAVGNGTPYGDAELWYPPYGYPPLAWPGAKLPALDLTPAGDWDAGYVFGASGPVQGGYVSGDAGLASGVWFGTPQSFVTISTSRFVNDVCGNQQVGHMYVGGKAHAICWQNADDATMIELHPAGADRSWALATDGVWQGGYVTGWYSGYASAVIWKGYPWSAVDMHPPNSRSSKIEGMAVGAQVGYAQRTAAYNFDWHAILWHDTPESWINMHPSAYNGDDSELFATTGDMHVGDAEADAGIWFGDDPESFHNLEQYLPGATGSSAYDIEVYQGRIYIVGYASFNNPPHAVVWIGTILDTDGNDDAHQPRAKIRK